MEPSESSTILCGEVGDHLIEGIADGFIPGIFERHQQLVDTTLAVDSEEAVEIMRRLARQYGLFVGPSSGANLIAAKKVREVYPELETVVTLFCDEGEKYISEHFADDVRITSETYT
jgi:cysteine synthase